LEAAGFVIRRVRLLTDFAAIRERHVALMAAEAAQVHEAWFARHGALYHPKTVDLLTHGRAQTEESVATGRASRLALREALEEAREVYEVDLWLSPPAPGAAPAGLESTGDPVMNLPWTHAGLPTVNLPTGLSGDELPLGLQLAGAFGQDEQLLADALQIEAAVGVQLFPKEAPHE
jgi:Asp-tRNA(Asn)/Glu-tRNA(Gln) amidotransferase A subunit family amidase